ncbi:MAG TPA: hypothetical protein VM529_11000, partial [Gemmata sp.]|nr:hypothetical protein [Gemmata sp.]
VDERHPELVWWDKFFDGTYGNVNAANIQANMKRLNDYLGQPVRGQFVSYVIQRAAAEGIEFDNATKKFVDPVDPDGGGFPDIPNGF